MSHERFIQSNGGVTEWFLLVKAENSIRRACRSWKRHAGTSAIFFRFFHLLRPLIQLEAMFLWPAGGLMGCASMDPELSWRRGLLSLTLVWGWNWVTQPSISGISCREDAVYIASKRCFEGGRNSVHLRANALRLAAPSAPGQARTQLHPILYKIFTPIRWPTCCFEKNPWIPHPTALVKAGSSDVRSRVCVRHPDSFLTLINMHVNERKDTKCLQKDDYNCIRDDKSVLFICWNAPDPVKWLGTHIERSTM